MSYLHRLQRKKHMMLNHVLSLVAPPSNNGVENVTLHDHITSRTVHLSNTHSQREFLSSLMQKCSPFERDLLRKYAQGYSYGERSLQCGVNDKAIDKALQRMKKKAQRVLDEQGHVTEHLGNGISVA